MNTKLGSVILSFRNEKQMSLMNVAENAGITAGYLSMIENNKKSPSLEMLNKICLAMNVKLEQVMLRALKEMGDAGMLNNDIKKDLIFILESLIMK